MRHGMLPSHCLAIASTFGFMISVPFATSLGLKNAEGPWVALTVAVAGSLMAFVEAMMVVIANWEMESRRRRRRHESDEVISMEILRSLYGRLSTKRGEDAEHRAS